MAESVVYFKVARDGLQLYLATATRRGVASEQNQPSLHYLLRFGGSSAQTVRLWPSGKATFSAPSVDDCHAAARTLRENFHLLTDSSLSSVLWSPLVDGCVELSVPSVDLALGVALIEYGDVTNRLADVCRCSTDAIAGIVDLTVDIEFADFLRHVRCDDELVKAKIIGIDLARKASLLEGLDRVVEEARTTSNHPGAIAATVTSLVLRRTLSVTVETLHQGEATHRWKNVPIEDLGRGHPELGQLRERGPSSALELARSLKLSLSRVRTSLNWLERKGLVKGDERESVSDQVFAATLATDYRKFVIGTAKSVGTKAYKLDSLNTAMRPGQQNRGG